MPNNIPVGWLIMFNDNGSFYRATSPLNPNLTLVSRRGGYVGGTARSQAETVIHELAHLLVPEDRLSEPNRTIFGFWSDYKDNPAQNHNAALVDKYCSKIIKKF